MLKREELNFQFLRKCCLLNVKKCLIIHLFQKRRCKFPRISKCSKFNFKQAGAPYFPQNASLMIRPYDSKQNMWSTKVVHSYGMVNLCSKGSWKSVFVNSFSTCNILPYIPLKNTLISHFQVLFINFTDIFPLYLGTMKATSKKNQVQRCFRFPGI